MSRRRGGGWISSGGVGGRGGRGPVIGGLSWLLGMPARMHLRWLVIAIVMAAVMGVYGRVLVTAAPMPPSKPPAPVIGSPTSAASPSSAAR